MTLKDGLTTGAYFQPGPGADRRSSVTSGFRASDSDVPALGPRFRGISPNSRCDHVHAPSTRWVLGVV
jgi:hypothetical protein